LRGGDVQVKIVFATDFHLDACPAGYDLHADALKALEVVELESAGANLLVLGGDIFNTRRPTPRAYATVLRLLQTVACPVILVQGNHDIGTYGPLETVRTVGVQGIEEPEFVNERKVLVVTKPRIVGFGGRRLLIAPYMPQAACERPVGVVYSEAFKRAASENVVAAFCHLDIGGAYGAGGELPTGPQVMPEEAFELPCAVLNGHIHVAQKVRNVVMPGSLVPVAFGEGGSRAVAVLDV
jgi:DNA repair exonuclease SbcCD nuclease subunit